MLQKIESYIREFHMIEAGDHVVAGVSGGADSICMLLVLLKLREKFGHTVSVAHVEHGIRGAESLMDASFVRRFCEKQNIACNIYHCQVPEYAREHGIGEEEAGRRLRYSFFEEEKKEYSGRNVKIAVAHHLGDQAETMLFHMARGTGILGFAGMSPVRGDIIRPLLSTSRDEIEKFLEAQGQEYCRDKTNEADIYSRNRIRHTIMPALEKINSRAAEHMYGLAADLREISQYLEKQAETAMERCCVYQGERVMIKKEIFEQTEPALQTEILHRLLSGLSESGRDITREHIRQVQALFARQNGRRVQLPYRIWAARVYEGVELGRDAKQKNVEFCKKEIIIGNSVYNSEQIGNGLFGFRVLEKKPNFMTLISKKKYTKCFDYDKIKNGLCIRNRQAGDFLVFGHSGSRQKLKKYLINEKIPLEQRGQLLLLADGAHIMWIVGYRTSSYYNVDEHTRRILQVTFYGGKEDE